VDWLLSGYENPSDKISAVESIAPNPKNTFVTDSGLLSSNAKVSYRQINFVSFTAMHSLGTQWF